MYRNNDIVTLAVDKSFGFGEEALDLKSGICGMIVRLKEEKTDHNHLYVVDFGAYGQWYCTHSELFGNDHPAEVETAGWDASFVAAPVEWNLASSPEDGVEPTQLEPSLVMHVYIKESPFVVDVDADIARRVKEMEKGIK